MKILVTGFDAFGGQTVNPSFEAVKLIADDIYGAKILKAELPTEYRTGAKVLEDLIKENSPDTVFCVGQAGGRKKICLEQLAVNYLSATIADNAGVIKRGEAIEDCGKTALACKINLQSAVDTLNETDDIYAVSYSAGTFVCNEVYYNLLKQVETGKVKFGLFVHVPFEKSQVSGDTPYMELSDISRGLKDIITYFIKQFS